MVREEAEYKRIIGKKLLPLCNQRLQSAKEVPFCSSQCELKFFKMLSVLIKKSKDNIILARGSLKENINRYMVGIAKDARLKNKIYHIVAVIDTFDEQ